MFSFFQFQKYKIKHSKKITNSPYFHANQIWAHKWRILGQLCCIGIPFSPLICPRFDLYRALSLHVQVYLFQTCVGIRFDIDHASFSRPYILWFSYFGYYWKKIKIKKFMSPCGLINLFHGASHAKRCNQSCRCSLDGKEHGYVSSNLQRIKINK